MSKDPNQRGSFKVQRAIKRLENDLAEVDLPTSPMETGENEMLSLMVYEAANGIDISKRYPTFYKDLLNNLDLRGAFLDSLESFEKSKENELAALPVKSEPNLGFLTKSLPHSIVTKLGKNSWRVSWQRTMEQLQAIFSPSRLAYRSDPAFYEDPWLTLLRSEVEVEGVLYTVVLECTFSEADDAALSPFLNIAATFGMASGRSRFPIQSTLQWGTYNRTIRISEEGRARFPDIPFIVIFDNENKNINAGLNLTVEPAM